MLNYGCGGEKMSFNFNKLRGRIIEKYGTQTAFVEVFGVSENTFSKKMNNRVRFNSDDIIKITQLLEIPESEIGEYFFCKVS